MADQTDDIERRTTADRSRGRAPSLAEDGPDELPALLAIAVGIAVIVVLLLPRDGLSPATSSGGQSDTETAAAAADDDEDDHGEDEDEGEATEGLDAAALSAAVADAGFGDVDLDIDGGVVTATGEVADEEERAAVISLLEDLPGVERVIDELTVADADESGDAVAGTEVTVEASQAAVVLQGTVPSVAIADELVAQAESVYIPEQVDNQLEVDEAVEPPVTVFVIGSVTDAALHESLSAAFDGVEGVESVDVTEFELEESNELETSLNDLEPIQFASGSAQILPDSQPIVDQAATILLANPDVVVEIGGHTDTRGSDQSNQSLSQARADAVEAALILAGVENTLEARGFGEQRPVEFPDDTPEAQQANRRIEFRIIS